MAPTIDLNDSIFLTVFLLTEQLQQPGRDVPGQTRLADRLLSWFRHWNVVYLVADESGVGVGLVDWLAAKPRLR